MWETQCSKTFSPLTPLPASSKGLRKACAFWDVLFAAAYHDVFMMFWSRNAGNLKASMPSTLWWTNIPWMNRCNGCISVRSSRWFLASYIYVYWEVSNSRSRPHNKSHLTTGHGFECFQTWLPKNWRVRLWLVRQPYQLRTSLMTIVGKKPNPTNMMLWLCEILFSFIPCPIRVATLGREVTTFFKRKTIAGGRNLAVAPVDM